MDIKITPVELYFLGALLHANQIDYTYIAAMENIQDNYELHYKEAIAHLVSLGIVDEDFSGELSVCDEVKDILYPLFFGEKESSVDVCWIAEPSHVDVYKFHFLDDRITLVSGEGNYLVIKGIDIIYLTDFVYSLFTKETDATESIDINDFNYDSITRLIAVKNTVESLVRIYYDTDDAIFVENEINKVSGISKEEFVIEVVSLLKGYRYGI